MKWCISGRRGGEILLRFGDGLRAEECVGAGDELPRLPRRGDKGGAVSRPHHTQAGGGLGIKPH